MTEFDSVTLNGELQVDDAVAEQAKVDLVTAYDDAAAASSVSLINGAQAFVRPPLSGP